MTPNQEIDIQLIDKRGSPIHIKNVVMEIHLFTKGSFRYGFKISRTDEFGRVRVSYDELEAIRRRNSENSPMDYNTKLEDCDEQVRVVVPSEDMLREQYRNALRFYQSPPEWSRTWPANKEVDAEPRFVELHDPLNTVDIRADVVSGPEK